MGSGGHGIFGPIQFVDLAPLEMKCRDYAAKAD